MVDSKTSYKNICKKGNLMFHNVNKIEPQILTLLTTYQCTSACPNCCFNCSPKPLYNRMMALEEIKTYIDESVKCFPNIKLVVFTGGECTLLGETLFEAIKYARLKKLSTRVVTNGHWAINAERAENMIKQFVRVGLDEINYSTGDEHASFVDLSIIANAISATAQDSNFSSVVVNIEKTHHSKITASDIMSKLPMAKLSQEEKSKVLFINSPWIEFRKHCGKTKPKCSNVLNNKNGCDSILNTININPNGQLLSCCGLCSEYSPILKLGQIAENNLQQISNSRFNDLIKLWIYTEGPYKILNDIELTPQERDKHQCEYCFLLLNEKESIKRLTNLNQEKIEQILLNYYIKTTRYEQK